MEYRMLYKIPKVFSICNSTLGWWLRKCILSENQHLISWLRRPITNTFSNKQSSFKQILDTERPSSIRNFSTNKLSRKLALQIEYFSVNELFIPTYSTKKKPSGAGYKILMYWTNYWQPTVRFQQYIFEKTLLELCSLTFTLLLSVEMIPKTKKP